MNGLYFIDQRNALKRSSTSGSTLMAAPATATNNGTLYVTNLTIPHNLGYVPVFRVYYEGFNDGVIWPSISDRLATQTTSPLDGTTKGPGLESWADSTNLYIQLFNGDNTLTGTYPVYWVIYKDFQL